MKEKELRVESDIADDRAKTLGIDVRVDGYPPYVTFPLRCSPTPSFGIPNAVLRTKSSGKS